MAKQCGFVTILGAPNVGKSTLTNYLVGSKVSIVSPKVQTTRRRILGVCMKEQTQIVLIDTPGIFTPKKRLDRAMVAAAWNASIDCEAILVMADASQKRPEKTLDILDRALESKTKIFLVINKIDLLRHEELLYLIATLSKDRKIEGVFLISAITGDGVSDLLTELVSHMPTGPWMFPEDQLTDLPLRLLAAEITREKIFYTLHQELPYAMTIETESWEEFKNGSLKISQVIHVQKESQKIILIGKQGQQIKFIRERAGKELQEMLNRPIHLFLFIKITENWADERHYYTDMGLDYNA